MKPETLRFLSSMPHFSFLTPSEMEMVVAQASTTRIARGDRISVQGESRLITFSSFWMASFPYTRRIRERIA